MIKCTAGHGQRRQQQNKILRIDLWFTVYHNDISIAFASSLQSFHNNENYKKEMRNIAPSLIKL